ncbi:MAG: DUF5076 domain-containing protein [Alphaproteobacteria bacterium]|jgi:hypothetical protein|nr:DUF5076 domain-containing protein [Alphaproteobacteria bacterium]
MTNPSIRELPKPAAVPQAKAGADQVLSVWIVDQTELAAVFPPQLYGEDVWKWGRLLALVARYVAHAHAQGGQSNRDDAIEAIRLNFDEALRSFMSAPEPTATMNERDQP